MSGATIEASDSMMNFGVSTPSLPQVIFSFGHRAGVGAVARRRIADLAEVAPERHVVALQILVEHRHDADREVAGDAAADLEEADRGVFAVVFGVPLGELHHVLDAGADGVDLLHVAARCSGRRTCCRASSLPSRARTSGRFFSAAASSQLSFGSIW